MDSYQIYIAIAIIAVVLIGAYLSTQPQGFATKAPPQPSPNNRMYLAQKI